MKQSLRPSSLIHGVRATATLLLLIAWLSPSGNLYAQTESDTLKPTTFYMDPATGELTPVEKKSAANEADTLKSTKLYIDWETKKLIIDREEKTANEPDSLKSTIFYMDQDTGELKPVSPDINPNLKLYDTIPRFINRIVDIGFGFAFPLRDFHASDPSNEISGYALPGYSVSTGLFLGFTDGSEAGWYFGAAYSGFRKSMDYVDSLNAVLPDFTVNEGEEDEALESLRVNPDYRPRYDIFSLRTGFAFEGSDERISAYGSLLINMNFSRINSFTFEGTDLTGNRIRMSGGISTGFTASFGLRFQQQISLGVAFHYIGAPGMQFNEMDQRRVEQNTFDDGFENFPLDRRIHFLEVKMGYSFVKRGGWRVPKVRVIN
ncbi:MAG: hypothetical protein ABR572_09380 [Cryomorphaceae bacterium]